MAALPVKNAGFSAAAAISSAKVAPTAMKTAHQQ
jgi:hypothetical protein